MSLNLSLFSTIRPTEHYYITLVKSYLALNGAFVRAHLFGRKERCCSSSIASIGMARGGRRVSTEAALLPDIKRPHQFFGKASERGGSSFVKVP